MYGRANEILTDKKFTVFKSYNSEERIINMTNSHRFIRLVFISMKTDS